MTRSQNSFLNLITGLGSKLLVLVLSFAVRTAFLRYLGEEYLGLEGTFSSILSMLSLSELGLGTAIVFRLYKPIEENDRPRIRVLMKLYRRAYYVIGWVILGLGLLLIPALPYLVKNYAHLEELGLNAVVIFLLYLFTSISSYWFFAYKTAFMTAAQKTYILTAVGYGMDLFWGISNLICLAWLRSFTAYILLSLFIVLSRNLLYGYVCDRFYPFIKEPTKEKISKEELREFFKDCFSMFLYKVNSKVIDGSDNLVLSAKLGLEAVAVYYNIYGALRINLQGLFSNFNTAIVASLGSIYSTGHTDWARTSFRVVNFCSAWLYGVGAIGLAVLSDEFITMWVGAQFTVRSWTANGVTIATPVALLAGIETYLAGHVAYCDSFRQSMGLFQQLKYRPVASMIVNLTLSILLVPHLGIAACLVSTIVTFLTTNLLIDPIIIHRVGLQQSPRKYFAVNFLYTAVLAAAGILSWKLCGLIPLHGILGFLVRGCVCVAVPSVIFVGCFCRTMEFRFLVNTALGLFKRKALADRDKTDEEDHPHNAD